MTYSANYLPSWSNPDYAPTVTAKSVTRIGLRKTSKAYSRTQRFFCAHSQQHPRFMAGLLGASSDAPVSFEAGKTNPDNSATNPEIGLSLGGSKLGGTSNYGYHLSHCHFKRQHIPSKRLSNTAVQDHYRPNIQSSKRYCCQPERRCLHMDTGREGAGMNGLQLARASKTPASIEPDLTKQLTGFASSDSRCWWTGLPERLDGVRARHCD